MRRIKKDYYSNLNEKNITDNKKFWVTVTPFLSDKVLSTERITLIENDKIINDDNETANIMNTFFSNIVINYNVPEYYDCEGISRNISDTVLKAIVKYRNHPSITAIKRISNSNDLFSFDIVDREKIFKEINSLDHTKADIPTKIIKENADIFQKFFISRLMLQSMKEPFHQFSDWIILPQFLKKVQRILKIITDQQAF